MGTKPDAIRVTLDSPRTKRAQWGLVYADTSDVIEAIEIAAAKSGATQFQCHNLWGIYYELSLRHSMVDIELAREYAERTFGRSIEITTAVTS